jgi:integrase
MINLTNEIKLLKKENIDHEIKKSILNVRGELIKYYGLDEDETPKQLNSHNKNLSFLYYINEENLKDKTFDENFIFELLNFTQDKDYKNICVDYGICNSNIIIEKPYLINGFKFVLIDLWKNGIILLPFCFNSATRIVKEEFYFPFDNDFIKKFISKMDKNKLSRVYLNRLRKILMTTNYKKFDDFKLDEINELHIKVLLSVKGESDLNIKPEQYYIESFLADLSKLTKINNYESIKYKSWLSGYFSRYKRFNYIDFINNEENLKEYRKKYNIRQTIERNALKRKEKNQNLKNKKKIIKKKNDNKEEQKEASLEDHFLSIIKSNHSWKKGIPIYQGYNIENNKTEVEKWTMTFNSYLEQRKRNGYETTKTTVRTFNFLMNYIFFYLKLWNQKNKESKINIPLSPKEFYRTIYINNSAVSSKLEDRPFTITEMLEYGYGSETNRNSYIRNIELFFNFIIDFFEEQEDIWDSSLSNPIRKTDYYKEFKTKKTNKVIISKNIYGKLKKYLYSLEAFGEYIQEKTINGEINNLSKIKDNILKAEDFGYIPVFFDKEKCYPIFELPNILLIKKRKFDLNKLLNKEGENIIQSYLPSNTIIRAFILMLNTGLRAAQVSWLDRTNWDINEQDVLQTYYKLNVNTDKTKNNEWTSYISHNVYQSLKKETFFQNSMRESFIDTPSNYKGREYSRFENIICLFKSDSEKGYPIRFVDYWVDILLSFQNMLNTIEKGNYKLITLNKPKIIKVEYTSENNQYIPLRIRAIHTPHSMRATFCTHMAEYLERSEIAALVGHSSDLITSEVYIKPEDSVLKEKIERAVDIFDNGVNSDYFDKNSSVHSRPHLKGSSLQKAFSENREQTIELFNITSVSLNINKDSEEQSQKAINLLKEARADQVVFEGTHICPVGGVCPQEVMGIIGEKRRCGLCPLALKCVDNLNPIYAKQRDLMREIQEGKEKLDLAIKNKESNIFINNLEDKINLDIKELVSWKFSADILSKYYEELKENKNLDKKYYVEMPDMVKQHLQKVSISNEKEYLLTRIADSNAYSSYQNPDNKYQAEMLRKSIIRNLKLFEYEDYYVSEEDKIEVFCSMIKNMLDTNKIGLKQLINSDCFKPIEEKKELKKLPLKDIKLLK